MRLVAIILNFGCSFYEQITAQSVFMYLFYFVKKFTPTFKSTGRAIFYTNLIDRPAVYSTRASGLQTYSQTVWYQKYRIQSQVRQGFLSSPFVLLLCIFYQNGFFVIKGITHRCSLSMLKQESYHYALSRHMTPAVLLKKTTCV